MWIRRLLGVALASSIACAVARRSPQGGVPIAPLDAPPVLDSLRDRYTILQDSLDATRRHLDQAIPDPRRTIESLDSLALAVEAMVDSLRSTDNAIALALLDSSGGAVSSSASVPDAGCRASPGRRHHAAIPHVAAHGGCHADRAVWLPEHLGSPTDGAAVVKRLPN